MRRIYNNWLFIGFGTVIVAFLASTFFQTSFFDVRKHTVSLVENALPSVEHLSNARTELYSVEEALLAHAAGSELTTRLHRLESEMHAYDVQPGYEGEREAFQQARSDVLDFEAAVKAIGPGHPSERTIERVRLLGARADDALLTLIQFNVNNARRVSTSIDQEGRRAIIAGVLFDSAAAFVALLTMLFFRFLLKKYLVLSEAYQHGLERRAEELENFAGRVAHDLRGPLSGVILGLGVAQRVGPTDSEKFGVVMGRIRASIDRCESLIEALLTFASAGGSFTPGEEAEVVPIVRGVLEDIGGVEEEGIELEVKGTEAWAACSRGVLTSIVSNIIQNAVKYTRGRPVRRVTVRVARAHGNRVRVEVSDSGPGIPDALKKKIFEPFVRAPGLIQPGLGLGLATVKKLVDSHGGRVGVEDAPDEQGSVFWVELPAVKGHEASVSLPH